MIIGVKSNTHSLYRSEIVTTTAEGMLKQAVEALEGEGQIGSLTVNGPLGFEDLKYLRHLAGRDSLDGESGESVRLLNLTNTQLHDNVLPDSIFKNCVSLQRIYLPATIEHIGREAFSGCSHLYELRVPTKVVPELDGPRVFQDVPMGSCMLYVRSGMKTKYLKKAQWKSFGEKNIGEEGTSIQARNTIRKYGEENPEFYYTISGDDLHGQPELVCEATPSSPAGRYPIYVKRGTIDRENVDFIDGYLIVQKLDATATVGNYTREEGQPNPEFGFSAYDGLISLDSIPAWLEAPVFVTTADETSPAGEYPIMVESATAESYNMTCVPGVLTITVSTAINGIDAAQRQQSVYYTLGGSRVEGATRAGIYLMRQSNGKVKKVRVARK
jgi:hypothetical protein